MSNFNSEQTTKTPFIGFDAGTGIFEFKGKSIPEHSVLFYKPIFEWLDAYVQNPLQKTVLNVQLDYFNTSSSKCVVDVFKKIESIVKNNKGTAEINWYYNEDDDDMLEVGEDYKTIIKIPFNLISFVKK